MYLGKFTGYPQQLIIKNTVKNATICVLRLFLHLKCCYKIEYRGAFSKIVEGSHTDNIYTLSIWKQKTENVHPSVTCAL